MWSKKGLIFNVEGDYYWNKSHAQVPVVDVLADRLRIYYSTRDLNGKSRTSFVEVSSENPKEIIYKHDKPILELGKLGSFDDSGIMPTSIINVGGNKYLYYIGWTTRGTVPYHNSIGLAISKDGINFEKAFPGPIISVTKTEPYFSGTAFVLQDAGIFKMWYLSCIGWQEFDGKAEPFYNIKYSESVDGINWDQTGTVAIDLNDNEGGIASASVIKHNNVYHMWYSVRGKEKYRTHVEDAYKIGYATSVDGINWKRIDDKSGITISADGWDSQMIAYPFVVKLNDILAMFYNGNGFGKTGLGYCEKNIFSL